MVEGKIRSILQQDHMKKESEKNGLSTFAGQYQCNQTRVRHQRIFFKRQGVCWMVGLGRRHFSSVGVVFHFRYEMNTQT